MSCVHKYIINCLYLLNKSNKIKDEKLKKLQTQLNLIKNYTIKLQQGNSKNDHSINVIPEENSYTSHPIDRLKES